ncbi:MAG: hypothetical protein ABEH40_06250 [Haloferacaceae archaeon]
MRSDAGPEGRPPAAGDREDPGDGAPPRESGESAPPSDPAPGSPGGFGARGWVLVGAVVLSTVVVPGLVYALPALPADAGLPFLVAMLALPLLPAVLLGAAAVWSMTAATGPDDRG